MAGISDYIALMKVRLISLLLFVAIVSMVAAKGVELSPVSAVEMLAFGFLGLGGAAALNNYVDYDIDEKMSRTRDRPIPSGRVNRRSALVFGLFLVVVSVVLTAFLLTPLAALFVALGAGLYVGFYSLYLKRRTPSAVIWGGLAGSMPALGGWAAVSSVHWLTPLVIFLIIFLWQPAHFWSLSMYSKEDYESAGVPVMPVLSSEAQVLRAMVMWNVALLPATYLLYFLGSFSSFYLYAVTVLDLALMAFTYATYRFRRPSVYRSNFRFSLVYMFMILLAVAIGRVV
jgi:protoheme IX farnesyltransferase